MSGAVRNRDVLIHGAGGRGGGGAGGPIHPGQTTHPPAHPPLPRRPNTKHNPSAKPTNNNESRSHEREDAGPTQTAKASWQQHKKETDEAKAAERDEGDRAPQRRTKQEPKQQQKAPIR